MYDYSKLEHMAELGGYTPTAGARYRVSSAEVHTLYSGLLNSDHPEAHSALLAVTRLRRWLLHGDNDPPEVRGAGFVRSDRQVWIAYTMHPTPALIRGKRALFEDLRRYLSVTADPEYDGTLGVRTKPSIKIEVDDGVVLRSEQGVLRMPASDAVRVQNWLSSTLSHRDRQVVLCLPGTWTIE